MQIEEIIRSCGHEKVAEAAVSSIGARFYREVREAADTFGMSVGRFTVFAVARFAQRGDERDMRAVVRAMAHAQEPLLAGLHRVMCIILAARGPSPHAAAQIPDSCRTSKVYAAEADVRRERLF